MWEAYKIVPHFYTLPTVTYFANCKCFVSLVLIQMNDYYRNFGCFKGLVFIKFLCLAIILSLFSHQEFQKDNIILCNYIDYRFYSRVYCSMWHIILRIFLVIRS